MSSDDPLLLRDRWARVRFAVVGNLLVSRPKGGELKAALKELSQKTWEHPRTQERVRFGYSTIEKWYSAEHIVQRSRGWALSLEPPMINGLVPSGQDLDSAQ